MVKKHCEHIIEGGVYCGLKPIGIVVDYLMKKSYCVCRKHKISSDNKNFEFIKLDTRGGISE